MAKAKDTAGRWRVVYIAFTFSNGDAVEFGKYPDKHGVSEKHGGKEKKHDLKFEQWFQKPNPGQICGMNGMTSSASVCDAKSGYLQWVKVRRGGGGEGQGRRGWFPKGWRDWWWLGGMDALARRTKRAWAAARHRDSVCRMLDDVLSFSTAWSTTQHTHHPTCTHTCTHTSHIT